MLQHFLKRLEIEAIPLRWYFLLDFIQGGLGHFRFHAPQPRLEGFDSTHRFVHAMPRIQAPERRVRKVPLARVETKTLIDHASLIGRFALRAVENRLPPVYVARPLIKDEHS